MTTTLIHRRQPLLPTINLALAGGAAVLAVIAIASDDVTSAPTRTAPVVTVAGPAHPLGVATFGIPCDQLIYTRC